MELIEAIWNFLTNPFILLMLGIGCVRIAIKKYR